MFYEAYTLSLKIVLQDNLWGILLVILTHRFTLSFVGKSNKINPKRFTRSPLRVKCGHK